MYLLPGVAGVPPRDLMEGLLFLYSFSLPLLFHPPSLSLCKGLLLTVNHNWERYRYFIRNAPNPTSLWMLSCCFPSHTASSWGLLQLSLTRDPKLSRSSSRTTRHSASLPTSLLRPPSSLPAESKKIQYFFSLYWWSASPWSHRPHIPQGSLSSYDPQSSKFVPIKYLLPLTRYYFFLCPHLNLHKLWIPVGKGHVQLSSYALFYVRVWWIVIGGTSVIDYRVPEASGSWKGESAKGRDAWSQFQLLGFWLQEPCLLLRTGHFGTSVPTTMCPLTWGALLVFIFMTHPLYSNWVEWRHFLWCSPGKVWNV